MCISPYKRRIYRKTEEGASLLVQKIPGERGRQICAELVKKERISNALLLLVKGKRKEKRLLKGEKLNRRASPRAERALNLRGKGGERGSTGEKKGKRRRVV